MNPLLIATDGLIGGEFTSLEIATRGYIHIAVVVAVIGIPEMECLGGRVPTERWKREIIRREKIYADDEEVITIVAAIVISEVLE